MYFTRLECSFQLPDVLFVEDTLGTNPSSKVILGSKGVDYDFSDDDEEIGNLHSFLV